MNGWHQFKSLFIREVQAYLYSPMSYLVWAVFLIGNGYLFVTSLKDGGAANLDNVFNSMAILLIFVIPLLTMRLIAEELKLGTLEVLLTDPISEMLIILSKYLASVSFLIIMLLPTLAYPLILSRIGQPDPGPILGGYLGLICMGSFFLAVGLLTSTLTSNQVGAATLSFIILLVFWLLGKSTETLGPGLLREILDYTSAFSRFSSFRRGVIDTRSIIYSQSLITLCLFISIRLLYLRRLN